MTLMHILLSLFGALSWATEVVTSKPVVDIYWNKTNDIFQPTNEDHIIDVNLKDTIQFLCPFYNPNEVNNVEEVEHYIIYRLPKQYYDSCHLPVNMNEDQLKAMGIIKVRNCSTPYEQVRWITYIDNFIPLPGAWGGVLYEPGQSYYFTSISTGSLSGLHNRLSENSACRQHNMKAVVRVCCTDNATFTCPEGSVKCSNSTKTYSTESATQSIHTDTTTRPPTTVSTSKPTADTPAPIVSWTTLKSLASTPNQVVNIKDNSSSFAMISTILLLLTSSIHWIL